MDKEYWNQFYAKRELITDPTPFAHFSFEKYIKEPAGQTLLEIGSGNGRDSLYFSQNGLNVIAIDQSSQAIELAQEKEKELLGSNQINFFESDFVEFDYMQIEHKIDIIYSRFTIHSISENEEDVLLKKIADRLQKGGRFFIEVRTTKDDLHGVGEKISDHEYRTDHYRRFLDPNQLLIKLINLGFEINFFIEENGLAKFQDNDPIVSRIITTKIR